VGITARFKIGNVGHLPAEQVSIFPIAYATGTNNPESSEVMRNDACREPSSLGRNVFLNETTGEYTAISFYIEWPRIRQCWLKYHNAEPYINPFVVVYVAYREPLGEVHHTPIAFSL
jgi:hypothetical protein